MPLLSNLDLDKECKKYHWILVFPVPTEMEVKVMEVVLIATTTLLILIIADLKKV
jgi:hypothetical protein